jgi:CubicO group peptidase (beta-lactamase class C family)
VHLRGFGRADEGGRAATPQTPFFIGSNSKSFTALAVMQLAEAGKVDLDAPVQRCIPWFRVADPEASALITVRHLLNQTSGLTERAGRAATLTAGMHPLEPAVRALATTGLARPPGTAFEYSNLNYTTLGLVVEMAGGEPFDAYLNRHIFEPLTMHHTYTAIQDARRHGLASGNRYWFGFPVAFDAPGHGGTVPAGGIISTTEDMSRYLAMYQDGRRYHGQVVLSPAGITQMMQPGPPQKRGAFAGAGQCPAHGHQGPVRGEQDRMRPRPSLPDISDSGDPIAHPGSPTPRSGSGYRHTGLPRHRGEIETATRREGSDL